MRFAPRFLLQRERVNNMSLTSLILKFAAPLPDIEKMQRFLFIGPHPDDIEIGAGATAAKLAASGKDVCFLICTDGRYGDGYSPELTTAELIYTRRDEAKSSAKMLGIEDVRFLNLMDGGLYNLRELLEGIMHVVGEFKPDVIFAPDPCVTSECHADHLNVGDAARKAANFAPYEKLCRSYGAEHAPVKAIAFYMTAKPTRYVKTSSALLKKQLDSVFICHLSQFPACSPESKSIPLYLKIRSINFGLRRLCGHAEGFRVLGTTHMHCLPEAGK